MNALITLMKSWRLIWLKMFSGHFNPWAEWHTLTVWVRSLMGALTHTSTHRLLRGRFKTQGHPTQTSTSGQICQNSLTEHGAVNKSTADELTVKSIVGDCPLIIIDEDNDSNKVLKTTLDTFYKPTTRHDDWNPPKKIWVFSLYIRDILRIVFSTN